MPTAKYNNINQVPVSMAVWLAHDEYDHNDDPNHISVTGLIKPTKQLILAGRVPHIIIISAANYCRTLHIPIS